LSAVIRTVLVICSMLEESPRDSRLLFRSLAQVAIALEISSVPLRTVPRDLDLADHGHHG